MGDNDWIQLIAIVVLIFLSALASATETALMALGHANIHRILDEEKRKPGLLSWWRTDPDMVLTAILVNNNLINILASSMATGLTAELMAANGAGPITGAAVAIAVGVMTFLIVLFGEVVPKTLARNNPESLIPFFPFVTVLCRLVSPFAWVIRKMGGGLISLGGGKIDKGMPTVTEAEIETMIRVGSQQGSLTEEKQELFSSILDFSTTMTKEIMVPRTEIVGFSVTTPLDEILQVISDRKFSRYPVFEDGPDTIVGIVTVKDLIGYMAGEKGDDFNLAAMAGLHRVIIAPETKLIGDLLKEFQKEHIQMAVAVDEFGGTAGIVTTEDIIEEIVGEIYDEHEKADAAVRQLANGDYLIRGVLPIEELMDLFDLDLPDQDNYETVGGMVMTHVGRVPSKDEVIELQGLRFEVRERTRTRILSLCVRRLVAEDVAGEGD